MAFDSSDCSFLRRALLKASGALAFGAALAEPSFAATDAAEAAPSVLEVRQYKIFPGKREQMIEVFDGKLIEGQEQVGMRVLGQYRDLDDPNRFTWLREFPNFEMRAKALTDFYTGPVWKEHRGEAN